MNNIGPHDEVELDLMLAGVKPLAKFVEVSPLEKGGIPEEEFASYVASGRIIMREVFGPAPSPPGYEGEVQLRHVLYALPGEAWRIDAMVLLISVYEAQGGWDEGLERMTGKLLGYEDQHIEAFIKKMRAKGAL